MFQFQAEWNASSKNRTALSQKWESMHLWEALRLSKMIKSKLITTCYLSSKLGKIALPWPLRVRTGHVTYFSQSYRNRSSDVTFRKKLSNPVWYLLYFLLSLYSGNTPQSDCSVSLEQSGMEAAQHRPTADPRWIWEEIFVILRHCNLGAACYRCRTQPTLADKTCFWSNKLSVY